MLQPTDTRRRKQGLLADEAGFSFIDLMLAMVVLTIGVLAMADLQVIASRSNNSSRSTSAALNVATAKMEEIKDPAKVFTSIVAEAATTVTVLDPPRPPLTFTRQVTVKIDTPIAGSKTVTVIVTWTDSAGKTHTLPMATVIAAPL